MTDLLSTENIDGVFNVRKQLRIDGDRWRIGTGYFPL